LALTSGARLGVYEIGSPHAEEIGEVYRASNTRLQCDLALKLLPPEGPTNPERRVEC